MALEDVFLRIEAQTARYWGVDTTVPGWRDEFLELRAEWRAQEEPIATPHVAAAIAIMEEQFVKGGAS